MAGHVSTCGGRVRGTLLVAWFGGLGLKTRAEVPMRNGRHVAASGRSRGSKATGEEVRWPSDQIILIRTKLALGLYLFGSCILG